MVAVAFRWSVTLVGCSEMLATDAATVTVPLPLLPSLVAEMVAVPAAIALTTPAWVTVATSVLLDVHAIGRSVTTAPLASLTVAVAWSSDPRRGSLRPVAR